MTKAAKPKTEELKEFLSADGQSVVPEPYNAGSSARSADRTGGMKEIPGFATKAEAVQQILGAIQNMNKDDLGDLFKGLVAPTDPGRAADQTGGEKEPIYLSPTSVRPEFEGSAHPTKDTVTRPGPEQSAANMRLSPSAVVAKEDIDEMFAGQELSEEVKEKTKVIFEATVNARLIAEMVRIEEENEQFLDEAVEQIREELTEKVDSYLTYIAEEWVNENIVDLDSAIKCQMAEELLLNIKEVFENNYIQVAEDKVDIVASMNEQLEEMREKYNELVAENLALKETNSVMSMQDAFDEVTEGLNDFQVDKLATLSEGIVYDTPEEYVTKLNIIKEAYINPPKKAKDLLSEENGVESDPAESKIADPKMKQYVETAVRTSKSKI